MGIQGYLRPFIRAISRRRRNDLHPSPPPGVSLTRAEDQLGELVRRDLGDRLLIVVSNREPYIHTLNGSGLIDYVTPIGGLTATLDPIMRLCGGVWVAQGSGDADREVADAEGRVRVPPQDPRYTLRRVWLTPEQEEGYYYGFANQALWPLCHIAYERPVFNATDWRVYGEVNSLFAQAVAAEVGDRNALVFVQDYHLSVLPQMVRQLCPSALLAHFWHIPWPGRDIFRICPWAEQLLDGLLGNDLIAFHTRDDCENFIETVDKTIESLVDRERLEVRRGGRKTLVRYLPVGVDFESLAHESATPAVGKEMERLRKALRLRDCRVGLGLDRLDYTKGILERLDALERFFKDYPEYQRKVVFIQVSAGSRPRIDAYRALSEKVVERVDAVNRQFSTEDWTPVVYLQGEAVPPVTLMALRRLADFCLVNSLHDGMNLVAKEYVASRVDENGVLILSQFAGAAHELPEALLINPYATEQIVEAIRSALGMPKGERERRMRQMRRTVQRNSTYKWASDIFAEMAGVTLRG